jgi:hypothetical protein
MYKVINYLTKTPFFFAPNAVSGDRHHKWPGGLAQHCLGVCRLMLQHKELNRDSAIIVGLLHDISKANIYELRPDGVWAKRLKPLHWTGDGYRSYKILTTMLQLELSEDEIEAIRYHMHTKSDVPSDILQNQLYMAIRECDKANSGCGD